MLDPDGEESDENVEDVDPFAELGVGTPAAGEEVGDALDAFVDDDEEESEEFTSTVVDMSVDSDDDGDDDDDPFAALGVGGPSIALATDGDDDLLSAFMDDEEAEDEDDDNQVEIQTTEENASMDAKDAYRMVLETVWVDGVLDPGEVSLLARRRQNLGISFAEHLDLVREMLGE
mgnify:CR=1 FL=1